MSFFAEPFHVIFGVIIDIRGVTFLEVIMLWVITMNTNNCRVYHYQKHLKKLTLLKELDHPENRLKNHELLSDRPGHYNKSKEGSRGSYEPTSDAKENVISHFSRDIAKLLHSAKQDKLYEKLILITHPHMLGLLNQHLDKSIQPLITQTINKDLQTFSEQELLTYLIEHID